MKDLILTGIFILAIIGVSVTASVFFAMHLYSPVTSDDLGNRIYLTDDFSEATTSVSTTRVKLLSSDTGRQYARVEVAPGGAGRLYLYLTSASTTVLLNGGIPLQASSTPSFVIDETNLYTGEVWGIANAATTVFVTSN